MKFEKADIKPFKPITITLETELDYNVMCDVLAADPHVVAGICFGSTSGNVRECFGKDTDNTAYQQLTAIKER